MKAKTQTLSVVAQDVNGISASATDISAPFADLVLGGALATTDPYDGSAYVDFSLKTNFTPLVNFTTGATGSVAVATIIGLDQYGAPQTEDVTMPGATANVSSLKPFGRIDQITIDGAYTNLEVGVRDEIDQFGKWVVFDTYANPFEVYLDLVEETDGSTLTIELTSDPDIWVAGSNFDVDTYDASTSPFAAGVVASADGKISADGPFIAARLRHTAGTAGKWRARFVQSGGGRGR